jgi:hypothetical protein
LGKKLAFSILIVLGIASLIYCDVKFISAEERLLISALEKGNYQDYFNEYAGKYRGISFTKGQAIPLFIFVQAGILAVSIMGLLYIDGTYNLLNRFMNKFIYIKHKWKRKG